jgi:DNA end-binding protein Ku
VRSADDYFDGIEDEKVPKDMLDLAIHIVDTKKGKFDPKRFEDQYEDALKDLIARKSKGLKIEAPSTPSKSNVINLMDALRKSVSADKGSTGRKKSRGSPPSHAPRSRKKPARSSSRHRRAS